MPLGKFGEVGSSTSQKTAAESESGASRVALRGGCTRQSSRSAGRTTAVIIQRLPLVITCHCRRRRSLSSRLATVTWNICCYQAPRIWYHCTFIISLSLSLTAIHYTRPDLQPRITNGQPLKQNSSSATVTCPGLDLTPGNALISAW